MRMFLLVTAAVHLALFGILFRIPALTAAILLAFVVYHLCVAWGVLWPRSTLFGPNRSRLGTSDRVVALTFDDGPHPKVTPRLLDLLKERGVVATFFLIGRHAERYPEIVRRIVAEGHVLGNHTQSHSYLFWALPPAAMMRELERAQRAIELISGGRCRFFRPPVGMKNPLQDRALGRLGLEQVSWEVRFLDRAAPDRVRLERRLRRCLHPGSVLLLHDGADRRAEGNPAVLDALPPLLSSLETLGYRCVPLH